MVVEDLEVVEELEEDLNLSSKGEGTFVLLPSSRSSSRGRAGLNEDKEGRLRAVVESIVDLYILNSSTRVSPRLKASA